MFANAYKKARSFTKLFLNPFRLYNKTIRTYNGSFIILNSEGWVVTVAHLLEIGEIFNQHSDEIAKYEENANSVSLNPEWITHNAYFWGKNDVQIHDLKTFWNLDLAIGRLEPFNSKEISTYPILKDPKNLDPGTSLCKLGFPFSTLSVSFDEGLKTFNIEKNSQSPYFPIEGIFTRNIVDERYKDGKYVATFIETSSPGLKGQSGGPIFDKEGTVWGIQSQTGSYSLGLCPTIENDSQEKVEENQFLNVGFGVHPKIIVEVLKENKIEFELSDY